jgi:hypothetical protein
LLSFYTFAPHNALIYNESNREGHAMKKKKYLLTHDDWRILIHALSDLRNRRIAEGKCIDTVNDTMLAVMNAKTKRIKVAG